VTEGPASLSDSSARAIAFYLPQFHPIKENDEWWGTGFTEWTNVAKAKPLFRGHWQPHLPADLGFYDLRVPEVRERQAAMARGAGIEAFCYWHYWFGEGRRILERPFQEVLESGAPNFPFCLAWANQSWTGIWHGSPKKILVEQRYPGPADEAKHFNEVLTAFKDKRYVRVQGKPVFVVFDPQDHPDPDSFIRHWRQLAEQAGLRGLYFVAMWNKGQHSRLNAFDAVSEFGPGDFLQTLPQTGWAEKLQRVRRGDFGRKVNSLVGTSFLRPQKYKYKDVVRTAFQSAISKEDRYLPTVLPNWDNTPRSGLRGVIFEESTPELFREYVAKAANLVRNRPRESRIIFVKAWNEWAEGNYMEPDTKFGSRYLEAMRLGLGDAK
jgi:hypothetical protein